MGVQGALAEPNGPNTEYVVVLAKTVLRGKKIVKFYEIVRKYYR